MATAYKKRNTWYVGYTDHVGRQKCQATTAVTKTEAKKIAQELERKSERQRLGLEPLPSDSRMSLAELCEWWLENRCPPARAYDERKRLQKYVLDDKLGRTPVAQVTTALVEDQLRKMEVDGYSPATINGLRGTLNTVFNRARKAGVWSGPNPIQDVESRRVPTKNRETLKAEEVPILLPHVPEEWRGIFVAAIYTGGRKGDLFGLRKSDVDLDHRILVFSRSYDHETNKGGHADAIPIAEPLAPVLKAAIEASPSDLVFPDAEGKMRSPEADPQKVLRHALGRAGLVVGYDHICRRCKASGKPHVERHRDAELRRCPVCGMKLWPKALPRPMRFHDLRHTTATLLLRAGVQLQHVQRILRHRDVKLTVDTYGHLECEDLRAAVATLPASPFPQAAAPEEIGVATTGTPVTTRLLPGADPQEHEGRGASGFPADSAPFDWSGRQDSNLRPPGPEPGALPG